MQALILAAGKSTRTQPLTVKKPKHILKILDKTVMQRNLDQLVGLVDEAIIVVGFMKEQIIEAMGDEYCGIKIKYVEQKEQLGTGHAIMTAESLLKDRFLIMPGDDLFSAVDLKRLLKHKYACLADESENPQCYGVFSVDEDFIINDIEEKPIDPKSNLVNTACWVMDRKILDHMKTACVTERGEYEITCALKKLCSEEKVKAVVINDFWLPMGYPWHYLEANVFFCRTMKESVIEGKVEDGVVIKGIVHIGKGTVVKSGTYIEGPVWIGEDCEIGPGAYLRKDTIILDGVRTRAEIIDSVLMDNVTAKHNCYLGHSVLGERCNIAAGTVTADYRHDGKNNMTLVKGCKIDSGRRKLGAFIGDDVTTGIGTMIYPGRKLWPGTNTLPGEVVKEDKK